MAQQRQVSQTVRVMSLGRSVSAVRSSWLGAADR